ncbi:polyprotein precursor [Gill-associated virus]|uniref:Polyprotein n=2 Tax=Gill-associated virus TaxID=96491 RepID=Q8JNK9_GAVAU|nr:polyprotein precursor [Gill-associated virus]AAK84670.1 polyprotein precursor [Gill-associated virus]
MQCSRSSTMLSFSSHFPASLSFTGLRGIFLIFLLSSALFGSGAHGFALQFATPSRSLDAGAIRTNSTILSTCNNTIHTVKESCHLSSLESSVNCFNNEHTHDTSAPGSHIIYTVGFAYLKTDYECKEGYPPAHTVQRSFLTILYLIICSLLAYIFTKLTPIAKSFIASCFLTEHILETTETEKGQLTIAHDRHRLAPTSWYSIFNTSLNFLLIILFILLCLLITPTFAKEPETLFSSNHTEPYDCMFWAANGDCTCNATNCDWSELVQQLCPHTCNSGTSPPPPPTTAQNSTSPCSADDSTGCFKYLYDYSESKLTHAIKYVHSIGSISVRSTTITSDQLESLSIDEARYSEIAKLYRIGNSTSALGCVYNPASYYLHGDAIPITCPPTPRILGTTYRHSIGKQILYNNKMVNVTVDQRCKSHSENCWAYYNKVSKGIFIQFHPTYAHQYHKKTLKPTTLITPFYPPRDTRTLATHLGPRVIRNEGDYQIFLEPGGLGRTYFDGYPYNEIYASTRADCEYNTMSNANKVGINLGDDILHETIPTPSGYAVSVVTCGTTFTYMKLDNLVKFQWEQVQYTDIDDIPAGFRDPYDFSVETPSGPVTISVLEEYHDGDSIQETAPKRFFIYYRVMTARLTPSQIQYLNESIHQTGLWSAAYPFQNCYVTRPEFAKTTHPYSFALSYSDFSITAGPLVECNDWNIQMHLPLASSGSVKRTWAGEFRHLPHFLTKRGFYPLEPVTENAIDYLIVEYNAHASRYSHQATYHQFGHPVAKAQTMPGVCPTPRSLRYKGLCYEVDWSVRSPAPPISGYPDIGTHTSGYIFQRYDYYRFKPKFGNGLYLGKVSAAASIGTYSKCGKAQSIGPFHDHGIITDMGTPVYDSICDSAAYTIPVVKYNSPYSLGIPGVTCNINDTTLICGTNSTFRFSICSHKIPYDGPHSVTCIDSVDNKVYLTKEQGHSYYIAGDPGFLHLSHNKHTPYNSILKSQFDLLHFSYIYQAIAVLLGSIGYILLALYLLLFILTTIWANIKYIFYTKTTYLGYTIPERFMAGKSGCKICGLDTKHLKVHARLHKIYIHSPMLGRTFFLWSPIYIMALFALLSPASALAPGQARVRGSPATFKSTPEIKSTSCSGNQCLLDLEYTGVIPIYDGAQFSVDLNIEGYLPVTTSYVVRDPSYTSSCAYLYTSLPPKLCDARINWSCLHTGSCKNSSDYLFNPLGQHTSNDYVVANPSNPLQCGLCPVSADCDTRFADFNHGCATINDGHAAGAAWISGDINGDMIAAFECSINNIAFQICDLQTNACTSITTDYRNYTADFETISFNIAHPQVAKTTFKVGALFTQGTTYPKHLFYDVPGKYAAPAGSFFSYQAETVPTGDFCNNNAWMSPGLATADIKYDGYPTLDYKLNFATIQQAIRSYDPLGAIVQCNYDQAYISTITSRQQRSLKLNGVTYSDEVDALSYGLLLNPHHCDFGAVNIHFAYAATAHVSIIEGDPDQLKFNCKGCLFTNNQMQCSIQGIDSHSYQITDSLNTFGASTCSHTKDSHLCNFTASSPEFTLRVNGKPIAITAVVTQCDVGAISDTIVGAAGNDRFGTFTSFSLGGMTWDYILKYILYGIGTLLLIFSLYFLLRLLIHLCTTMRTKVKKS